MKHVAVMGFEADDGKHMLVVVSLNPNEVYFNKNNQHLGHLLESKLVLVKGATVSERESELIFRTYQALKVALGAIH